MICFTILPKNLLDFAPNYCLPIPEILGENLEVLALTLWLGPIFVKIFSPMPGCQHDKWNIPPPGFFLVDPGFDIVIPELHNRKPDIYEIAKKDFNLRKDMFMTATFRSKEDDQTSKKVLPPLTDLYLLPRGLVAVDSQKQVWNFTDNKFSKHQIYKNEGIEIDQISILGEPKDEFVVTLEDVMKPRGNFFIWLIVDPLTGFCSTSERILELVKKVNDGLFTDPEMLPRKEKLDSIFAAHYQLNK